MSHHTPFARAVTASKARQERERGQACPICERQYSEKVGRIFHTANCVNNPLNNRRVTKGAREMDRQDREAAALRELDSPVYAEKEVGDEHRSDFDG